MKICFVIPSFLGSPDIEENAFKLVGLVASEREEVSLICAQGYEKFTLSGRVPYPTIDFPWPKRTFLNQSHKAFSQAVKEMLLVEHSDLIFGFGFSLWAYLVAKEEKSGFPKKTPCISYFCGIEKDKPKGLKEKADFYSIRKMSREVGLRSDLIISPGGHLREKLVRELEIPNEKIREIPFGFDLVDFDEKFPKNYVEKDPTKTIFLFEGSLNSNDELNCLIGCFRDLKSDKVKLVIANILPRGDGESFKGNNIEFLGQIPEAVLYQQFKKVDCLIHLRGAQKFVLEAMGAKLPVIAQDLAILPTMVGAENGFLIDPEDKEDLKQAMESFAALLKEDQKRLGETSRRKIEEKFSWPAVVRRTLEVCREVVR